MMATANAFAELEIKPRRKMTRDEFLAMPESECVERELIHGELWEFEVTHRHPQHAMVLARVTYLLTAWVEQKSVSGFVGTGDIRCYLGEALDNIVGIDVAFFSGDETVAQANRQDRMEIPPLLAVEITSPSDTVERLLEKSKLYLECGVKHVWQVNPFNKTIMVMTPGEEPVMYNVTQSFSPGEDLPGLEIDVAHVFRDLR